MFERYHKLLRNLIFDINIKSFGCKYSEPREILHKTREIQELFREWESRVLIDIALKDMQEDNNNEQL